MSKNKETVDTYMRAFRELDHEGVLSCLTDDVEWDIPGMFRVRGKGEFDKQIENDAFIGAPDIRVSRHTEENDVVISEGTVLAKRKDGSPFAIQFCDVFEMFEGRIRRLTSYLMQIDPAQISENFDFGDWAHR